jgi:hypothetical protein
VLEAAEMDRLLQFGLQPSQHRPRPVANVEASQHAEREVVERRPGRVRGRDRILAQEPPELEHRSSRWAEDDATPR